MVTITTKIISFAEYLVYEDGTDNQYELVDGKLILMPPASFLHSDIIDLIADLIKQIARENQLDIKVKTGDVAVRTGINSVRIPDLLVIDSQIWQSYRRDKSAVIEDSVILVVEVVSSGKNQIARDYQEKLLEYQNSGVTEYWIVDPLQKKITVGILENSNYNQTVFTNDNLIVSAAFPTMKVSVSQILKGY